MSILLGFLFLLVGYLVGERDGKIKTYREIHQECKKLGRFYIGDEVFYVTTKKLED